MSECASSCIRQLRMIDLLGKIMSILYPIRMFHSGAPLLRKKKKKLRRTAGENLCLCSLRLGAICFSPRTSKRPAQSEESAVVFNDGRWNAGNVKMPRVADQSSVRRQNCSQITRLHRRGGTAPSSCTAEEPRGRRIGTAAAATDGGRSDGSGAGANPFQGSLCKSLDRENQGVF
ncbi:hypothetical protein SEVIR_9G550750v4 [Setaria viridis]